MDKDSKYSLACVYSDQGKYKDAIPIFLSLIEEHLTEIKKADLFFRLASCYYFLDEFEMSLLKFKEAQKYDPEYEANSLGIYLSFVGLKKGEAAIEELNNFASTNEIDLYKDTLVELMTDIQKDIGTDFKTIVYRLAEKHGVPLIISE